MSDIHSSREIKEGCDACNPKGKYSLPMDFVGALQAMRENLAVGRIAWCDEDGSYMKTIGIKNGNIMLSKPIYPRMPEHGYRSYDWQPNQQDVMATDWSLCTAAVKS